MHNLKYIHKIYFILTFSLLIYIAGSISINIYIQQKNYRTHLESDLADISKTMVQLLGEINTNQDQTPLAEKIELAFKDINKFYHFNYIIFQSNGEIICSTNHISGNINSETDSKDFRNFTNLFEKIKSGQYRGFEPFKSINESGTTEQYLLYYTYIPEMDWVVATTVNVSLSKVLLNKQVGISIFLSVIFLVIVMIITILIGNSFGKQLSDLTNALIGFSEKNFDIRAKVKSNDEIGKLAILFNKMADTVSRLHSNLKKEVEERTLALHHGNEELQLQNEEIEQQNEEIRAINDEMQAMNQDLQESERKTRRLIENLEDEYFFFSQLKEGKYIYVSPSIKSLLGYNEEDVKNGFVQYLSDHPKNKIAIAASNKNLKGDKQPPFEIEIKDKQNNLRQFEILEVPVYDKEGNVNIIEGIAHEITERKRNEHIQKILAHISNAAMTSKNLEELIMIIREQLSKILDTQNFYIALYDKKTDTCSIPFLADENDDIQSFPVSKTMTGHVIKTKQSLMVTALQQEEMAAKGIIDFVGTRSKIWLGVPLHSNEEVIGVLAIQSYSNEQAYDEKDREILEIISNQISLSIERKKATENLKEEKDYAERILSVVPSAVFTVDQNKIITSWNKKAETITGWTAKETIGFHCHQFALKPCIDNCGLYDSSIKKPITNRECTIKIKNGRTLTILKNVDYLRDANSNIIGGIESFEDITERKRAEFIQKSISNISNFVSLNNSLEDLSSFIQEELSKLIDTTNYYIALYNEESDTLTLPFISDEKDKFKEFPAAGTLTGYVIRTQEAILADEKIMNDLEKKGEIQLIGTPSKIWLGVPLIILNKVIGVIAVQSYTDETAFDSSDMEVLQLISHQISISIERKRNSDVLKAKNFELETQKEELQTTLDSLQETQSQLIQSEKMAALGQLIAGIAHEINTPLGAINASVGNMSDSLDTAIGNLPRLLSSMKKEDLLFYLKLMKMADDDAPELSSKERRQLKRKLISELEEKNIKDAEKIAEMLIYMKINKHIDQVIPMLESPNAQFVLSNARNIISLRKNTQNINMAVGKASKVVFALKKFAHRDHIGEKVESDIIDGIETVLTLYHNQIKQGVEVSKDFKMVPKINCYPDEINQVWTNLFHNSLQAMDNKGKLGISVDTENEGIIIKISDTGSGIPNDLRDKIFQPFFTTKKAGEGSGIGLDIVKKIIDKHEGKIDFESKPGAGTTFTIWLPFATINDSQ